MNKQEKTDAWTLFHSLFKKGDEVWLITDEDDFIWGKLLAFHDEECALRFRGKDVWFRWDCIRFMSHDGFPVRALTGADGSRSIMKETPIISKDIDSNKWIYQTEKKECLCCKYIENYYKSDNFDENPAYRIICKIRSPEGLPSYSLGRWVRAGRKHGCNLFEPFGKKKKLGVAPVSSGGYDDDDGPVSLGRGTSSFGDPFLIEDTEMTLLNLGNRGDDFEDHDFEEVIVCKAKDGAMGLLYDLETVYMF